jgi:RHS repeat-associated protein
VVTAKPSGSAVNLVSNASGSANTNYAVSVSITDPQTVNYPSYFPSPSFTVDASAMSGGAAADSSYGTIYSYLVPGGGYAPNGNILAHSDSVMGDWAFSYDAMDRLSTAAQFAATPTSTQFAGVNGSWSYDSYGNRTAQSFSNGANSNWATYNPTNNRISTAKSAVAGYVYDASGNTLYDGNNKYWYDAEGQLCAVQSQAVAGLPVIQYVYDAEGARIAKGTLSAAPAVGATCAPPFSAGFTLTTRYLVDLGGGQVTELNTQNGTASVPLGWAHSNVFSAARLTATYDTKGLHYALADPLGTKRVQANTTGIVEEWYVSLPYGDALTPIPNPACTAANYCYPEDATEHHFTQKERDAESNNDYFFARYYNSAIVRFTTPDWSAKAEPVPYAKLDNPQSLNLYAYVGNNPMIRIDVDGHCWPNWLCNFVTKVKNKVFYGEFTTDTTGAKIRQIDRQEAKDRQESYRRETQGGQPPFKPYEPIPLLPLPPLDPNPPRLSIRAAPPPKPRVTPGPLECLLAPDASMEIADAANQANSGGGNEPYSGENAADGAYINATAKGGPKWQAQANLQGVQVASSAALALDGVVSYGNCRTY